MVLPLLMSTYGLRPWELDHLTRDELYVLVRAAQEAADGV